MKKVVGMAVLLVLTEMSFAQQPVPVSLVEVRVTAHLEKAEQAYREGRIEAARLECHRAFLIDPYDVRVHRMIVRVPLILSDPGNEIKRDRIRPFPPPNSAMDMQMIRFHAVRTGVLPPPLNPQLGK